MEFQKSAFFLSFPSVERWSPAFFQSANRNSATEVKIMALDWAKSLQLSIVLITGNNMDDSLISSLCNVLLSFEAIEFDSIPFKKNPHNPGCVSATAVIKL